MVRGWESSDVSGVSREDRYIFFLREVVQICAVVRTQGEAKVDVERSLVLVVSAKVEGGDPSD